ncbi:hypothetical protein BKA61DRAFT_669784 [Leptodontidium sp. MPI-SDFR-AT-0119]|nr:hypothetical protein BKA61DRAFT_669784 [Leptodontidium sp. MPI-SDFR-AT-0119]
MDIDSTFREKFLERVPLFLQDPSIWVPLIVGFYVLILGLCLTGALKRQKVSIRELRREQSSMFSMLDEESEDDVPVKQTISGKGKQRAGKKGVDVREWENLGCR